MTNSAFLGKLTPMLVATTVALTIIAYTPSRAYAQSGECCAQTQVSRVSCKTTGCSGTISYTSCLAPNGTNSALWKLAQVKCCDEEFTAFTANTGLTKDCGDGLVVASAPPTTPDKTLYVEGVWVRSCSGRYVFTLRPVAG